MEMDKALDRLYEMENSLLTIEKVSDYLDIPEEDVAFKIFLGDIESFEYNGVVYVSVYEVRSILEGRDILKSVKRASGERS